MITFIYHHLEAGTFAEFARLIRHPDVEDFLSRRNENSKDTIEWGDDGMIVC